MTPHKATTLEEFYQEIAGNSSQMLEALLPPDFQKEVGHFNVFDIQQTYKHAIEKKIMPYNRRAYYKISCMRGKNRAEYADKIIQIEQYGLLFATPKVPYHWFPLEGVPDGQFCVFTEDFLAPAKTGLQIDSLPIFNATGIPVFELSKSKWEEISHIFFKMQKEIMADYPYKYDLIRNYVMELIHYGQQLQPKESIRTPQNAAERILGLFIELLERQFSGTETHRLTLRTASDYANRLAVHVNHLNKTIKELTGKSTTDIISGRLIQEAKILLRQTTLNVSEIAYTLGFEETAHFSNFFKKHTGTSPSNFRV
jgi:AraC-like DNA-binding protein